MSKIKSRKRGEELPAANIIQQNAYEASLYQNVNYQEDATISNIMDQGMDEVISEIEEYGNPSTPIDQISVSREEILSNTPLSTKMSQINVQMETYGATKKLTHDFNCTFISSFIGNRVLRSTPVKKSLQKTNFSSPPSAAKLIANIQEMREDRENGENWSAKKLFPKSLKISSTISYVFTNKENITTNIAKVNYNTGSCSVKVTKLGTYTEIVKKLTKLGKEHRYDDKMLAEAIRKLSKNEPLGEPFKNNTEVATLLSNLTTLLFVVEVDRNCGALITNNMFLDLIEEGKYKFKDLPKLLPMAMKGAVKASKTFDKLLFTDLVKGYTAYNISNKSYDLKNQVVEELVSRNKKIFEIWIAHKGYNLSEITNDIYIQEIMKSIQTWLNFELRPFRLSEEDILPSFFRDNKIEEPEIKSNADYSIVDDESEIDNELNSEDELKDVLIYFLLESTSLECSEVYSTPSTSYDSYETHDYINPDILGYVVAPYLIA